MIVVDGSVVVDLLLQKPVAHALRSRMFTDDEELHAPHLIDLEIAQVLRRLVHRGEVSPARAKLSLDEWMLLPVVRHEHASLLHRIWALRESVTAYDAAYIALAETLGAPLLTTDARLQRAHGHSACVELI